MKYYCEEYVIGKPNQVGPLFDDTKFSEILEIVDRIQQWSNGMDFIGVLEYNLQCFRDKRNSITPDGRVDFNIINCCFSNYMNSFYTWKCYLNHNYKDFPTIQEKAKSAHILYHFGDRLRNYTSHNAFAITKYTFDVINEKEYFIIDPNELLKKGKRKDWGSKVEKWLNDQLKNDKFIEAYTFALEFYGICQEIQNELWRKQTQQLREDLSAIIAILPSGLSNIYNVSISSEDQTVYVGIGQIIAQFLKKAAFQYPAFIPDFYLGKF